MSDDDMLESVRAVADALELENVQAVVREVDRLRALVEQLRADFQDYAEHQSWRCAHPPHWYLVDHDVVPEGDCPCGLLGVRKRHGL